MKGKFKIKRDEFRRALDDRLLTEHEFSEKIGISRAHLNSLSCINPKYKGSVVLARKILKELGKQVGEFDDIFFWVN